MNTVLSTILILTSCAQVRRDDMALPEARVRRVEIATVSTGLHRPEIVISWPAAPAPDDEDDDQPAPPAGPLTFDKIMVERENFDRWLFGQQSAEVPKKHLEEILLTRVRTAARDHRLNQQQTAKLQLAGRGDIKRFFDEVENKRKHFEIERKTFTRGAAALRGLEPLSRVYQRGPFEDGSLFAKTLCKMIEDRRAERE
jgi:hypothetical protein